MRICLLTLVGILLALPLPAQTRTPVGGGVFNPASDYNITGQWDFSQTPTVNGVAIGSSSTSFASLTITGVNGSAGTFAARTTALSVTSGTNTYDVGMRITKVGGVNAFASVSALDLELLTLGGKAMRIFVTPGGGRRVVTYFGDNGALYTRTGVIVSGTFTNYLTNSGEDTTISAPSNDGTMIGVWNDVVGGIQVRAATLTGTWVWEGLDRNGNKTSSIVEDGSYWFGAGATHASMDTGISRASAGVVEINNTTLGSYGDLVARTVRGAAVAFASLPASPVEGMIKAVTDSNTNTWGATIAGGGANHVLAYYDGTNWTVAAK